MATYRNTDWEEKEMTDEIKQKIAEFHQFYDNDLMTAAKRAKGKDATDSDKEAVGKLLKKLKVLAVTYELLNDYLMPTWRRYENEKIIKMPAPPAPTPPAPPRS